MTEDISIIVFISILIVATIVIIATSVSCSCVVIDEFTGRPILIRDAKHMKSSHDGKKYKVHLEHQSPEKAAEILGKLNSKANIIIKRLKKKFIEQKQGTRNQQKAVKFLIHNYDPSALVENSPLSGRGDTSYTINKGKVLAICLREKNAPGNENKPHAFEPMQDLLFVFFHELSHLATEEWGHPTKFWSIFKFILHEIELTGMYKSVNYSRYPMEYCGMRVAYNPLYDHGLPKFA